MQLGSINRNQIIILIMVLQAALIGAVVYFVVIPKNGQIKEMQGVVDEKRRKVREVETTKNELKKIKVEVSELKSEIARLEQHFKKELFYPRTLPLLERLTDATKVQLIAFAPAKEQKKKRKKSTGTAKPGTTQSRPGGTQKKGKKLFKETTEFEKNVVEIYLGGTFADILNFLAELSTFPKLVVVDRLEFTKEKQQNEDGTQSTDNRLKVKMPLTFYVQKQQSLVSLSGDNGGDDKGQPPPEKEEEEGQEGDEE